MNVPKPEWLYLPEALAHASELLKGEDAAQVQKSLFRALLDGTVLAQDAYYPVNPSLKNPKLQIMGAVYE